MTSTSKRKRSPSPDDRQIYTSEPIEDRGSRFVGYFSPKLKSSEIKDEKKLSSATHCMYAWRRKQKLFDAVSWSTGHDDDGEQHGGKRCEKALGDLAAEGTVLVARWYGGVLLGPVRFTHIEMCAREAIKAFQSRIDTKAVIKVLQERDASIAILRELLSKKTGKPVAQAKVPDYSAMSAEVLHRLERARDATLSFVLKELDKQDS